MLGSIAKCSPILYIFPIYLRNQNKSENLNILFILHCTKYLLMTVVVWKTSWPNLQKWRPTYLPMFSSGYKCLFDQLDPRSMLFTKFGLPPTTTTTTHHHPPTQTFRPLLGYLGNWFSACTSVWGVRSRICNFSKIRACTHPWRRRRHLSYIFYINCELITKEILVLVYTIAIARKIIFFM